MSRGRRARLLVCVAITLLIMVNTIRHMFEGVRPFDWLMLVIEAAVLLLIAWEIGRDIRHKWKMRARHDELFVYLDKGNKLHWNAPLSFDAPTAVVGEWESAVKKWVQDTTGFLKRYSPQAAAMFLQEVDSTYFEVANNPEFWDTAVYERLRNLREIMEKCDVYF
jgi:hypothetical protein